MDFTLTVLQPSVFDHALLCLNQTTYDRRQKKTNFKFINITTNMDEFPSKVTNSWREPLVGRPMVVVWQKQKRLQPILKEMAKPLADVNKKISLARMELQ